MSLRSHESIYSTWSPASPTFSNASISTSGQYGEDEGPVSPRSISLAPYEDDERLHSIFVAYITYLCDHTDATTSTGEVIAQPLMATKTARFDRAGEFRPFRFRIQAFTTGFAEWLHEEQQRHGGPTIALPRLREFIWSHLYIVRYTHEGKKSKSKGNHIWTLESRLLPTHQRVFRPFYRTILPPTALRAQVGLEWHYLPKLWDPRASLSDVKVVWDSPGGLPGWMRWEAGVLRGVPREERNEVIGVRGRMRGEKGVEEFERRFELVVVGRGRG